MKLYLPLLLSLFIFVSCGTMEETTVDDPEPSEDETEVVGEYAAPEWYSYTTRSYSDSASFTGIGLAASVDEAEARSKATKQAVAKLKLSVDRYAENVRTELAEESGNGEFISAEFIIDLRNAVQNISIEDELETTEEHIETGESVHRIYVKVTLSRESALNALESILDNAAFTQALNEQIAL